MNKNFSSREIIRVLERFGFLLVSQKGSHVKFKKPILGVTKVVIVPHPRKDIPYGTFRSILRQAGISEESFLKKV